MTDFLIHLDAFLKPEEKRVLIVVDKDLRKLGELVAETFRAMKKIDSRIFDNVLPDVPKNTVMEGVKVCQEYDPKVIIAIGGGSAMDTAKSIFLLYERPDVNLRSMMPPSYLGLRKKVHWLVAMPTTSGTGAETTFIAVVTDTDRNPPKKIEVVLYELCPDFVVLNPDFVKSMPPYLTMGTGMDALAHAMGSYVLTMSTDFSDMCNLKAIKMIRKYLPRSVARGDDIEAREKMQMAAFIAGMGFGNVSGGIEHAMGHSLGSVFHTHHGVAVGMYLCASIAYQSKVTDRFLKLARLFKIQVKGRKRDEVLRDLLVQLQAFMREIKCPLSIKELEKPKISQEEYNAKMDTLSKYAFEDYTSLSSTRAVHQPQYRRLMEVAYENKVEDLMNLYYK